MKNQSAKTMATAFAIMNQLRDSCDNDNEKTFAALIDFLAGGIVTFSSSENEAWEGLQATEQRLRQSFATSLGVKFK